MEFPVMKISMNAARGATIAYQQALRWKIEQDDEYAAKSGGESE